MSGNTAPILETARVVSQKALTEDTMSLWLEVSFVPKARPGQFVSFYLDDPSRLLPRPISICDFERRLSLLRFVYRIAGEGTRQLSLLRTGDGVRVMGPLGNGYPMEEMAGKRVLLIGGGLGIPPMLGCLTDAYREPCDRESFRLPPKAVNASLGYRSAPFMLSDFSEKTHVYLATEDGSAGVKGNVLTAIREEMAPSDLIFACGPKRMLAAVASYAAERGIPCYVSLEERMACGVGACLGCVAKTKSEDPHYHVPYRRVCTDGPVFYAPDVDFS